MKNKNTIIPFKKFSEKENTTWRVLCNRRFNSFNGRVSKLWFEGWNLLEMSTDDIPDFKKLNKILFKVSGWEVVMTNIEYEESSKWISALASKKHRITDFIRDINSLEYTPLPDIFHDVFGHLPYLAIPQYARILEKFGKAMLKIKNKTDKEKLVRLAWYAYEFSLIKEDGQIKAFGTGLISSQGELENAFSSKVVKVPYDIKEVSETPVSPHEFHKKLFILENLDQLERIVDDYLK
jgi:phenylalanine-4-hydroxylase